VLREVSAIALPSVAWAGLLQCSPGVSGLNTAIIDLATARLMLDQQMG
jgi:hypothetical protein